MVVSFLKRDASDVLGVDTWYAARGFACAVPSADRCSLAAAIEYMRPPFIVDPETADPFPVSPSVLDVFDVHLDT